VATFEELAYEASLRSLDKQSAVLSDLRVQTGVLVASSSVAISFFGGSALVRGGVAAACAVPSFVVAITSGLYALAPRRSLVFSVAGSALYEQLFDLRVEDIPEVNRRLAYDLDRL
jgi:hypothetical protein